MPKLEQWVRACSVDDVPADAGACVMLGGMQLAIFNFTRTGKWFATQNRCPHWGEEVLSRGLLAEHKGEPQVACPFHKRTFNLESGACTAGDVEALRVFPVRIENGDVFLDLGVLAMQ